MNNKEYMEMIEWAKKEYSSLTGKFNLPQEKVK